MLVWRGGEGVGRGAEGLGCGMLVMDAGFE